MRPAVLTLTYGQIVDFLLTYDLFLTGERPVTFSNSYQIDRDDIVVSVGQNWDAFAAENGALGAKAGNVVGRKLWDFVQGFETQSFLKAIFFACRMDMQPFEILYRCDAPEMKRLFRLRITPNQDGGLTLDHTEVQTKQSLVDQKITNISEHYDHTRCSVCCSFLIGENWVDTFTRPDERYFAKSYGICPECKDAARLALNDRKQHERVVMPIARGTERNN